nr:MAG TPA: hypothetical protein [Caudoviricetes sp.]
MPRLKKLKKTAKRLPHIRQEKRCVKKKKGCAMYKYRNLLNVLCIVTSASILMGCQSSTQPSLTAIKPPADLVQPCPKLPKLEGGTGADVLPWSLQVIGLYNDCKARHKALSELSTLN